MLPQLDINPRIPLQRLKQPPGTALMTFPPAAPPELLDLFFGIHRGVVVLGEHPFVVDDIRGDGRQESRASDEGDE